MIWLWVFLGGGVGSILRFLISKVQFAAFGDFPLGTFAANFLSCLILGFLIGKSIQSEPSVFVKYFFIIGFCGGFSTFSTFTKEVYHLLEIQNISMAFLYILISLTICLAAYYIGIRVLVK